MDIILHDVTEKVGNPIFDFEFNSFSPFLPYTDRRGFFISEFDYYADVYLFESDGYFTSEHPGNPIPNNVTVYKLKQSKSLLLKSSKSDFWHNSLSNQKVNLICVNGIDMKPQQFLKDFEDLYEKVEYKSSIAKEVELGDDTRVLYWPDMVKESFFGEFEKRFFSDRKNLAKLTSHIKSGKQVVYQNVLKEFIEGKNVLEIGW